MGENCTNEIPTAWERFQEISPVGITFISLSGVASVATALIFAEELVYFYRTFKDSHLTVPKIWLLALYPIYAFTSFLGILVPRSGTLVDFVSNSYVSVCMYEFVQLLVYRAFQHDKEWSLSSTAVFRLRTPPCCCCCVCLPSIPVNRKNRYFVLGCVYQVALIRPALMFIAAVMWTNGSYIPGVVSADNGYIYMTVFNLVSTLIAIYGLLILRSTLAEALPNFNVGGKFLSLVCVLLSSVIPSLIITVLIAVRAIPCNTLLSARTRGSEIVHVIIAVLMVPFSLMARHFYHINKTHTDIVNSTPTSQPTEGNELT